MAITQVITPLPPAPARTDPPAVFVPKADAHVASLDQLVTEENLFGEQVNTTQVEINTSESNAADSETASAASAAASAASADLAASAANFKGKWSDLTGALNKPASVEHNGVNWQLLNDLADVTTSEPGQTADYSEINPNIAIKQTGGGALSAATVNQIEDSLTYDLPLAADYADGKYIDVEKTDVFKNNTPLLQRKPASVDLVLYSGGTDTDVQLDQKNVEYRRFTSNGVNRWSLS